MVGGLQELVLKGVDRVTRASGGCSKPKQRGNRHKRRERSYFRAIPRVNYGL